MKRRIIAVLLCAAMIIGMVPMISISVSAAPSTTTSEVATLFNARSQGKHPRVLADESDFQRIRKLVQTDPYMKTWYAQLYEYSVGILSADLCVYQIPDGKRLLDVSREASQRITWLAMTYQISGEYRFAERAIAEMMNVCSFKDWNPSHFLDVGQMAFGVGLGYDWLYHELTSSQRTTIAKTIYNYAIVPFDGGWYQTSDSNWNPWCHGGVAIAACAVYESYSSACQTFLSKAVTNIQYSMTPYTPLGGYPEGPGYYVIGMTFTVLFIEALRSTLGTEFGLADMRGMREAGNYLLGMNGNVNTFNFGDGSPALQDMPALHWFASYYNMPQLSLYQRDHEVQSAYTFMSLLWYDPEIVEGMSADDQQLDHLIFSDYYQSIASFRSNNGDASKIYAAIKSGNPGSNHSDMDVGTFVMEAMGERWFQEMGSDNYNMTGYFSMGESGGRWTYYKKRAEGQNTLVINPDKTGGQQVGSKCQITQYKSGVDGGYAVVNMLAAYDTYGVSKANRGLMLFDNRSRVLLRDEITCTKSSTIYWFAHTSANITLSADKKTAELTLNGKKLMAQVASPSNATFSVMDANPLSTSPAPAGTGEHSRSSFRKLAIKLSNVTSANISVVFTPIVETADSKKAATSVAISSFESKVHGYATGTKLEPNASGVYEIRTADQLAIFSEMVAGGNTFSGKTVKLMNDIDMQNHTLNPIGGTTTGVYFQGTFDGGKHVIRNLAIFKPGVEQVGLFGRTASATIKNVGIESGFVFGGAKSGCLIGVGNNTTIEGCFNMANFIGNGGHVGGLIGQVGGTTTIKNSYNNASISNTSNIAGGLIGYISSKSTVTIANSYHTGSLTDSMGRCGLIGFYNTSGTGAVAKVTVSNCLSTTSLKPADVTSSTTTESYTNSSKVTKAELASKAILLGSAFMDDCDWDNEGCPVLAWQVDTTLPSDLRLSTAAELRLLAYTVNSGKNTFSGKTVYLTQDVDLDSREWVPIGGDADGNGTRYSFNGTFDGQGYAIYNLCVSTNRDYSGFFGSSYGDVKNVGIQSGRVVGHNKVGGLCGYAQGTVKNSYNRASVKANTQSGGLIGQAGQVAILNCYNNAAVTATNEAGGIVGYFSSAATAATVTNCYHTGTLTGTKVAGIGASINDTASVTIYNCYVPEGLYIANGGTKNHFAILSAADLKAAAPKLGGAFDDDTYRGKNGGYPVLTISQYHMTKDPALKTDSTGAYCIYTADDLRALAYMVNVNGETFKGKTVKLCADIDLESKEWIPIGGNTLTSDASFVYFQGNFDGCGHVISNLSITSGNYRVGLFGTMSGGRVSNLGIESGVVIGKNNTAGIVGSINGSVVISNCYNKANVSAASIVGGIVGMVGGNGGVIENCYNTGSISATTASSAGGIVGYFASSTSNMVVRNCYGNGKDGYGIIGEVNAAVTTVTMDNCHTLNTITAVGVPNSLIVTKSTQLTAANLRKAASTLGNGFAEDYLVQNGMFPVLAWENGNCATSLPQVNGVYQISNAEELRLLSYLVRKGNTFSGKKIVLTADIDLLGKEFLSIGGKFETTSLVFRGHFDGRGHVVRNLNVVEQNVGCVGLFGYIINATVENVGVESGIVIGGSYAGGLVGAANYSTIRACYNKATVYGTANTGGLVGQAGGTNGVIENCYNVGSVSTKSRTSTMSGLLGYISSSTENLVIKNSYSVGNVNGLIGTVNATTTNCVVQNSYGVDSVTLIKKQNGLSNTNSALISADKLKGYASVLGDLYEDDTNLKNNGYPVLFWENGPICKHEGEKNLVNAKEATCTQAGYTGDAYCADCGELVSSGETIKALGHSYNEGVVTSAPNCEETGVKTFTCGTCGNSYTEVIGATGHDYESVVTAPTCDAAGYTTYTCACGDSYVADQVAATGHIYNEGVVTTAPTCTDNGVKTFTCVTCGDTYTDAVLATGHTYTSVVTAPTCTGEGYTTHTCICGDSYVDGTISALGHNYENGICTVCGSAEVDDETIVEQLISLVGANVKLGTELNMNFFIDPDDLSGTDYYAEIRQHAESGVVTTTIPYEQWEVRSNYLVVPQKGIAARQMSDKMEIVIYESDGTQASAIWVDSIRSYAMRILEKQDAKTKTMLVDMLNYGAAAQSYFQYNLDDLANNLLSETQKAYATESVSCTDQRVQGPGYYGSTLVLKDRILLNMYFSNITPDMYAVVSFTDHKGNVHETRVEGSNFAQYNSTVYGVTVDELVVADGDQLVTIVVYDQQGNTVASASDSINSYAARQMGKGEMYEMVAKFTASAYAYFH